ncbi:hypothetical protein CRG98_006955, partial [Punica granatum]
MSRRSASVPLLLLLLLLLFSFSLCSSNSLYDSFLQCLTSQRQSFDQASKIVYQESNSSFASVLNSYVRNRRFNTSSTPKPLIIVTPLLESDASGA